MRQIIKLAWFCLAASSLLMAADYRFVKINVPKSIVTEAHGINARGDIVGTYTDADDIRHGFLLHKGEFTTIDVPGAAVTWAARGINARGDIVGNFDDAGGTAIHGYLLSNGQFTQIDYPGASGTVVENINNADDITGTWFDRLGNLSGFIRRDGKFHNVSIPGGFFEAVRAAQDNGRVLVGTYSDDGGVRYHGFIRRKPGEFEQIDYPGLSVPCTGVRYIDQRGVMVGGFARINADEPCHPPFRENHGFLLQDGEFTLLDFPESPATEPMCINDDGVIVGRYTDRNGGLHGFRAVPID
jgi:uncharacterized membrane protein